MVSTTVSVGQISSVLPERKRLSRHVETTASSTALSHSPSSKYALCENDQVGRIFERFHQTIKNEFYARAFRRNPYRSLEEIRDDVDAWVETYNAELSHSGNHCYGKPTVRPHRVRRDGHWPRHA